jgi:hypothetical protein
MRQRLYRENLARRAYNLPQQGFILQKKRCLKGFTVFRSDAEGRRIVRGSTLVQSSKCRSSCGDIGLKTVLGLSDLCHYFIITLLHPIYLVTQFCIITCMYGSCALFEHL